MGSGGSVGSLLPKTAQFHSFHWAWSGGYVGGWLTWNAAALGFISAPLQFSCTNAAFCPGGGGFGAVSGLIQWIHLLVPQGDSPGPVQKNLHNPIVQVGHKSSQSLFVRPFPVLESIWGWWVRGTNLVRMEVILNFKSGMSHIPIICPKVQ